MRICVQILLRAVYARIHGAGRRRVREEDLREEDSGALVAANRYHGDHTALEAGEIAGAARTASEIAARGGEGIARGGIAGGSVGFASIAGDYGWRRGTRSGGRRCEGSRRAMVFLGSAVSDAVVGEAVLAVCEGEVSAAGETVPAVVFEKRLRAGRLPAQGFRTCSADTPEV